MINEGDKAPKLTVNASDGSNVDLAAPGTPVVLYFYPKDDTTGCTKEARDFTELADDFARAGARIIGVSRDRTWIKAFDYELPDHIALLCDLKKSEPRFFTQFEDDTNALIDNALRGKCG